MRTSTERGTRTVQVRRLSLRVYRFLTRLCSATAALYVQRFRACLRPFTAITFVEWSRLNRTVSNLRIDLEKFGFRSTL